MSCHEDHKVNLTKLGLSVDDVTSLVDQWGEEILGLVQEALSAGLTYDFIKHVLAFFGPYYLGFALLKHKLSMVKKEAKLGGPAPIIEGEAVFDSGLTDLLMQLVAKILPLLFQQLNPQIIQAIIQAIIDAINGNKPAVKAVILEVLNDK